MNLKAFLKKNIYGIMAAFVISAFTVYALLDTFVLVRSYASAEPARTRDEIDAESGTEAVTVAEDEVVETENYYSDGGVTVSINEYRVSDTTVYVADVAVANPEYILSAFADGTYGKNVTDKTSSIADEAGAIIAINGDFYGSRNKGYVIRNGVLYRSVPGGYEDLVMWRDGTFSIVSEDDVSAEELIERGAYHVFSFGPSLVENGEVSVTTEDEVGKAMASNPRTAIAYVEEGHYLFIVSDGRTDESEGLTLYELAEFAKSLGAVTCYNLDGGGSSTMYFLGEVVNNPTTNGKRTSERSVSDIVYVGK